MSRDAEAEKYARAYRSPAYKMGEDRKRAIVRYIDALEPKTSLLDVGTGRGETLHLAEQAGFQFVQGTEIVPYLINTPRIVYAQVHSLPFDDQAAGWVTMFDVMEHLLPGDDERAVKELCRVAQYGVVLTIADFPSFKDDDNLHINLRRYPEWDALLRSWCDGWDVVWLPSHGSISEGWRLSRVN